MTDAELHMTIDECVNTKNKACVYPVWKYIEFFCGNDPRCRDRGRTDASKKIALEMAKKRVVDEFFVIGVLEQFEDTLKLFDKMLPSVYATAPEVYNTPLMQMKRQSTKTVNVTPMSLSTRQFFMNGPLKYDFELYTFVRQLFNERLKYFGIERKVKT